VNETPQSWQTVSIREIDVVWITAVLGCDGDTIAMPAATLPSLEDMLLGGILWIPKGNFLNPFLARENGEEFMLRFHRAWRAAAVHPSCRGVDPDETNKAEGYKVKKAELGVRRMQQERLRFINAPSSQVRVCCAGSG
jgi:hydrogenase small subunit